MELVNLLTKHYQKFFVTDSLCPLILTHIVPDGKKITHK